MTFSSDATFDTGRLGSIAWTSWRTAAASDSGGVVVFMTTVIELFGHWRKGR
jgi:hypothetical protein